MSQTDCVGPMKVAMKQRRDMIAVACDSFMKMFQLGDDELVEQVSAADDTGDKDNGTTTVLSASLFTFILYLCIW